MSPSVSNIPVDFTQAEHLVLESPEPDPTTETLELSARRPGLTKALAERLELRNRAHGVALELELFADGRLELTESRRGEVLRTGAIDLCFLDPEPELARHVARRMLRAALVLAGLGTLAVVLSRWPALASPARVVAVTGLSGALGALLVAGWRTHERVVFRTRNGRAPAVSWRASFGCLRRSRRIVPRISRAIRAAEDLCDAGGTALLRAEMREHYRLKDTGVIEAEHCTAATQRILARFD